MATTTTDVGGADEAVCEGDRPSEKKKKKEKKERNLLEIKSNVLFEGGQLQWMK